MVLPVSPRLTEQRVAKTDRHGLGLDVVLERGLAELAADTRLLVTAEGQLVVQGIVCVDPDGAGAEGVGDFNSCVETTCVHGGAVEVS